VAAGFSSNRLEPKLNNEDATANATNAIDAVPTGSEAGSYGFY